MPGTPIEMKVLAGSLVLLVGFGFAFCDDPPAPAPPQCDANENCATDQVCSAEGACVDPCGEVKCGVNSACLVLDHVASCTCNKGFEGDPIIECTPERPLCVNATDCSVGEACSGGKCISELCVDKTCGENALCSAGECFCDLGYAGDPTTACILIPAPQAAPTADEGTEGHKKPGCVGNLFPQPIGKKQFHVIHRHKANWHNAFLYCVAHGMQLATIENEQENKEILNKIEETGIRSSSFYVSGTDYAFENHWKWMTTGLPIHDFTYWHNGRPYRGATAYNCMAYYEFDKTSGYRWWDHLCAYNVVHHFICQDYA